MNQKKIVNAKRLIADIPLEIHHEIKTQASWFNISMRKYILIAILEKIQRDKSINNEK